MSWLPLLFTINCPFLVINANVNFRRSNAGITRVSEIVDEIDANIHEINLSSNEITRIYRRDFAKFSRCRKIDLWDNKIQILDVGAFEGLSSLQRLWLWSNRLTIFPNLTDLPRLSVLYLADNRFDGTLPSDILISKPNNLQFLKLNGNNIESAPAEFFANFPRLKTLHIYQNSLSRVPQIHSISRNLEEIVCGTNPIQSAHSSDFVRNGEKSALKLLQWSGGSGGNIALDDDVFANLDSLQQLYLVDLDLPKLPDLSNNVDTLKKIMINGNPRLTYIDPTVFLGDPPDYDKTVTIEDFIMNYNSFQTVPEKFLKALKGVQNLHFIDDGLECFPMSALRHLGSLKGVYLENNNISTLGDIGHRGRRGFRVDISGNPLICDERYDKLNL